ncbi:MAG: HupE/UreJ family protein [Gemmobacter sp.]
MLRLSLPLALVLAGPAAGHTGHLDTGHFVSGLLHPVLGSDHVLAMLAVGLWAALTGGRAVVAYPLAFMAAMLAGGLLGAGAAGPAAVEPAILASVVVVGAVVALALRAPMPAALALLAPCGIAHGYAHGLEGPGGAGYAAGFLLTTAALHLAGIALGRIGPHVARLGGATVALSGVALALA